MLDGDDETAIATKPLRTGIVGDEARFERGGRLLAGDAEVTDARDRFLQGIEQVGIRAGRERHVVVFSRHDANRRKGKSRQR
ncbi:MAG: hypothetical protein GVY18_11645 [Bacteroidetes bacterium]|nr:hypothetical protein [Bacteroidota bacterium]